MAIIDNLVYYLPFSETSGARQDVHGSKFFGAVGDIQRVDGVIGSAIELDGSSYLQTPSTTDLQGGTSAWSIMAWVFPTVDNVTMNVVNKWDESLAGEAEYMIRLASSKQTFLFANLGGTTSFARITSANLEWKANAWNAIFAKYDGSQLWIRLINDDGDFTATQSYSSGTNLTPTPVNIGRRENNSEYFIGRINHVAFWKRALSDDEFETLYSSGNSITYPFEVPTTHIRYAFPGIPWDARGAITTQHQFQENHPIINVVGGGPARRAELETTVTGTTWVQFDLGVGNSQSVDYLAMVWADMPKRYQVTGIELLGSNLDFAISPGLAVSVYSDQDFQNTFLKGRGLRHYFETFDESASYRYWIFRLTSATPSSFAMSKLLFGRLLNLNRDPQYGRVLEQEALRDNYRSAPILGTITTPFITHSQRDSLTQELSTEMPFFIAELDSDRILGGVGVMYVYANNFSTFPRQRGLSDFQLTFEEVI